MIQKIMGKIGEITKSLQGTQQGNDLQNIIKKLMGGLGQG